MTSKNTSKGIETHEGIPVVTIRGELDRHKGGSHDSYEAIQARVEQALATSAPGLVLRIDSAGGVLAGCIELARAIRKQADAQNKKVVAYIEGEATSGGYTLLSAAHHVMAAPTGIVGGVGVTDTMTDMSAAIAASGARITVLTSGARKADGHWQIPTTTDALEAGQARINGLADVLFGHVASYRPQLTRAALRALEGGVRVGRDAVRDGLADSLGTLNDAIALARGGQARKPSATTTSAPTKSAPRATTKTTPQHVAGVQRKQLPTMKTPTRPTMSSTSSERARLLDARPDITAKLRAALDTPKLTAKEITGVLRATPVERTMFGTRPMTPNAELDRRMGTNRREENPVKRTSSSTILGTMTTKQANELLKSRGLS